ncbi:hypothetical protein GmHk_06G016956 [Glycine max]|nr:hypothetical protein GmHk_06G016956 [Glycine max]
MHIEFLQEITINLSSYPRKKTKAPKPRVLCEQEPKRNLPSAQTRKIYSSLPPEIHAYANNVHETQSHGKTQPD